MLDVSQVHNCISTASVRNLMFMMPICWPGEEKAPNLAWNLPELGDFLEYKCSCWFFGDGVFAMFVFSGHMGFAGGLDTLELGLLGGTAMTHPHWHQGQDIFITEQLHLHWGMCQWNVSTCKWKNHADLHKDRGYSTQEHEKEQWACLAPTCQPRFCSYPCVFSLLFLLQDLQFSFTPCHWDAHCWA